MTVLAAVVLLLVATLAWAHLVRAHIRGLAALTNQLVASAQQSTNERRALAADRHEIVAALDQIHALHLEHARQIDARDIAVIKQSKAMVHDLMRDRQEVLRVRDDSRALAENTAQLHRRVEQLLTDPGLLHVIAQFNLEGLANAE